MYENMKLSDYIEKFGAPKFDDVFRAYNGKHGCMCGCLGDYVTAKKELEDFRSTEVAPRKAKARFNAVMRDPQNSEAVLRDGELFYIVTETKTTQTVVYFAD